jgi:2-methylcitrate dehydratase PrpD
VRPITTEDFAVQGDAGDAVVAASAPAAERRRASIEDGRATLSERAAEWVSQVSFARLPVDVIEQTKLRILDLIGVMLAARSLDVVQVAKRAATEGDPGGDTAIVGHRELASLAAASFINGVMSAVLEFDDTHLESNIHPTGPAVAVAIPECHRRGLPGTRLIESVLVASELTCRLGLVAPIRLHEVGFHPTAVYGIFGAVYALAKARSLTAREIVDAIGAAGSMSAGLISSFEDGTSTKTLHVGLAAASAVRAVGLARQGISGPSGVFEGRFGWFRSHVQSASEFRFGALTEGLGAEWEVLNIASKVYPCAYTLMPHIAATLALREQHRIVPADVAQITCHIMPRSIPIVCEPLDDKLRPRSTWHGRISLQHTVAEALVLGRMDKNAYAMSSLCNPEINALADKVRYIPDPAAGANTKRSGGKVSITLRDGRQVSHTIDDMPGTRNNPASVGYYAAKFQANAGDALSPGVVEKVIDAVLGLEKLENVAPLFDMLSRAPAESGSTGR